MRIACLAVALPILALAAPGSAQTRADLELCRTIADSGARLACYDAIRIPGSLLPAKYERVDLDEFRTNALSYRGDLVEIEGWVRQDGPRFTLGSDAADPDPVPVDYDRLPRRDRETFIESCAEGCAALVQGRVRPVNFTTGISADTLTRR